MQVLMRPWGAMHYAATGPEGAPPLVFANSLGSDLRLWDALLPLLPQGARVIRYDKRGHGLSDDGLDDGLGGLAADLVALIEEVARGPVILIGLSIGGLIAQRVAADRPDLVRALVLSNTAARLGTAESWAARIAAVEAGGIAAIADGILDRWFAPAFRHSPQVAPWRNMLSRTAPEGYIAACQALAEADQSAATAGLRMPALVIGGEADGASPPDVVEATARLIPGAAFHLIPGAGHLPPVEAPAAMAAILRPFLERHLHV